MHLVKSRLSSVIALAFSAALVAGSAGCSKHDSGGSCSSLSGSPWVPNVANASASNHGSASVSRASYSFTAPILGPNTAWSNGYLQSFTFTVGDLGTYGSISLVAQLTKTSSDLAGQVAPLLVHLTSASTGKDLVGFDETCATAGALVSCPSGAGTCVKSACIQSSSAYYAANATQAAESYSEHQFANFTSQSVNTFPTCISAGGTGGGAGQELCNFSQGANLFSGGKLPTGTYTATYALASSSSRDLNTSADYTVTVVQKADSAAGGAVDLNVVLVGNPLIQQSRTDKGKANLDMLFENVESIYRSSGIRIGTINAVEWDCGAGGDEFANVPVNDLGRLFEQGSGHLPANEGRALNIYLVSTIKNSPSSGISGTLLGLAGGIPGPMLNGTPASGLVFTSFEALDTMNPNCSGRCDRAQQEKRFRDMSPTIAHEMGHYLGLNHPSESNGSTHDLIYDTPIAANNDVALNQTTGYLVYGAYSSFSQPFSGQSCRTACPSYIGVSSSGGFCPTAQECAFNHLMFYNAKNYQLDSANEDGNLISTRSAEVVNVNPFIQ